MSDPVEPAPPHPAPPVPTAPGAWQPGPTPPGVPPQTQPQVPPYAAPYATPAGYGAQPVYVAPAPAPAAPGTSTLGLVALLLAITAAVGASIVGAIAAFRIGMGAGNRLASLPIGTEFDFSVLSAVREWVLVGEIAFWAGTILGVWAIVQGIIAIVRGRGRVLGIVAVAVAVIGPVAFGIAVQATLTAGLAAGSSIGG